MAEANVNDPASVERIYPVDDFKREAGMNSVGKASVLHGVRIVSEPGPDGTFDLVRAKQQTGERDPEGDSAFLPPFLRQDAAALTQGNNAYAGAQEEGDALGKTERKDEDYAAFVARVIEIARQIRFKQPIGEDARLRGFHGG